MSLIDNALLPSLVLNMEQMADLLQAEDGELDLVHARIRELEGQLIISTSDALLSRHERVFGLPSNSTEAVEDRRARIIARLLGQGTTTAKMLKALSSNYYSGEVRIIEHPRDYRFEVELSGPLELPVNWDGLKAAIDDINPAHLEYDYSFVYQTGALPFKVGFFIHMGDTMGFVMTRQEG